MESVYEGLKYKLRLEFPAGEYISSQSDSWVLRVRASDQNTDAATPRLSVPISDSEVHHPLLPPKC